MGLTKPRATQIYDIDYKQATRVITLTNITLTGGAPSTVDGVGLSVGDRVLVAGQSTGSQNGLYYVSTLGSGSNGTWARSTDTNETGELDAGTIVMVTEGAIYHDTQWKLITNNPIVIGTTALTFEQNSAFAFGNVYANGTAVLATTVGDTLTVTAGNNISIIGNASAKSVTIDVAQTISVTGNITGGNLITGGTFSAASLNATGNITGSNLVINNDAVITGNLTVNGTTTTINSNVIATNDKSITLANNQSTASNVDGAGIDVGNATVAYWRFNNATTSWQSNVGLTPAANATLNLGGASNYWATAFVNQATVATTVSAVGNITGGNLSGTSIVGTLTTASQTNITAVGTLGSLAVTANTTSGNILTSGLILATGNITGGNLSGTNISGTLTTASQTNITAVGTLGSLAVTANVTGGNLLTSGLISATGNITGGNLSGTSIAGTLSTASQTNITSVGTLSSLAVTANVTGGNLLTSGLISATGNITGGNLLTGGLVSATGTITSAANITGANLLTGGLISSTGTITGANITGANLLTGGLISATGNITGSNIIATTNITSQGQLGGNNQLVMNSYAGAVEGAQMVLAFKGVSGLTGQGNGSWNIDVDSANTYRTFYQNAAGAASVMLSFDPSTNVAVFPSSAGLSATGNVTGANLVTAGNITAVGNIHTSPGGYYFGNGSQLTGISGGGGGGASITNGTSNIGVAFSANATVGIGGILTATFGPDSLTLSGTTTPGFYTQVKNVAISTTQTLPANRVIMSIAPFGVNNDVVVTVPDSSTLIVLA